MWLLRAGGHPIDTDAIVKGDGLGEGRHVLFEPEDIDDLKLEAKRTIDLVEVSRKASRRMRPMACCGTRCGRPRKMGLGQFIMRGREYIAAST